MKAVAMSLGLALCLSAAALAQDIELQVELLGPLGTQSSHKGDRVFARVVSPAALAGDTVEGKVTDVRSGNKLRGQSVLNFSFDTLQHGAVATPISAEVKSLANSKGQMDVDEEGRIIRRSSNLGKAAAGTAIGGAIGGVFGGLKGAAIGAGSGAVVSIVLIEVAADGPSIRLDPGSKVTLRAKSRSGPSLESLAGQPAASGPAPAAVPVTAAAPAPAAPAPAAVPALAAAPSSGQPILTAVKSDFIPGDRVIFYDDFSDMGPGEPPAHWKVRGAAVELKIAAGIRQLTATDKTILSANLKGLPKNFTVEAEVKFDNPGDLRSVWYLLGKDGGEYALMFWTQTHGDSAIVLVKTHEEEVSRTEVAIDFGKPIKQALWIQDGRLRVYLNGQRVVDANQIQLPEIVGVQLVPELYGGETAAIGYRNIRFAESTPDFSKVIASSGRYVTHGILFDTDSDRLKPESAPVIKTIASGLQANPELKLRIEGHTDATGAADHNLDLSKRRAEAVKSVLVAQFGIEATRLEGDGLGATKPIDTNDTAQGRAQNRRVELVRR